MSLGLGIPAMCLAIFASGNVMIAGMFTAEFFLLLNTGPLNAAMINSVGPHVRAMALAANIFVFHLLGDVPSALPDRLHVGPYLHADCVHRPGDRDRALFCDTVLRYEICPASQLRRIRRPQPEPIRGWVICIGSRRDSGPRPGFPASWKLPSGCRRLPTFRCRNGTSNPASIHASASSFQPATKKQSIEQGLSRLLALDYDNYEVIAVDDRSTDRTGEIMDRVAASAAAHGCLKVLPRF